MQNYHDINFSHQNIEKNSKSYGGRQAGKQAVEIPLNNLLFLNCNNLLEAFRIVATEGTFGLASWLYLTNTAIPNQYCQGARMEL